MNNCNDKLVSVYIITHNRVKLLTRAIDSVLSQTYKCIEIIVVDDCSEDNTRDVMSQYLNNYPSIQYHRNPIHHGACYSRNIAINLAQGTFVTGLDDDDYFLPNRIDVFLINYSEKYSFLCSNTCIKSNGFIYKSTRAEIISLHDILYENKVLNQIFISRNRMVSMGGFDESLEACQDYDMWIRIIQKYGEAKRIKEATYVKLDQRSSESITYGPKAFIGYYDCYQKYKAILNSSQRANRLLIILRVQNKKMTANKIVLFSKYIGYRTVIISMFKQRMNGFYTFLRYLISAMK